MSELDQARRDLRSAYLSLAIAITSLALIVWGWVLLAAYAPVWAQGLGMVVTGFGMNLTDDIRKRTR